MQILRGWKVTEERKEVQASRRVECRVTPGGSGESREEDQTSSDGLDYVTDFDLSMKELWKTTEKLKQRKGLKGRQKEELEGYFVNPDEK